MSHPTKQNIATRLLIILSTMSCATVQAGHHEDIQPPAEPGQVIVVYQGACPAESVDAAIEQVKKVIAYESLNSPISYKSSPGVWADGRVGAVDIHRSMAAMEQAFAWQSSDNSWSAGYDAVAASCGITVEDFTVAIFEAR